MSKEATDLFRKLVYHFDAEEWTEDHLPKLPTTELSLLSQLLGGPKSLPREEFVVRILCTRLVRGRVAKYESSRSGAEQLAAAFNKDQLKWMAGQMKLWRSGTKFQLAAVLIQWRDRARSEGQKVMKSLTTPEPGTAFQLRLFA